MEFLEVYSPDSWHARPAAATTSPYCKRGFRMPFAVCEPEAASQLITSCCTATHAEGSCAYLMRGPVTAQISEPQGSRYQMGRVCLRTLYPIQARLAPADLSYQSLE
jgi:hypothetical protein